MSKREQLKIEIVVKFYTGIMSRKKAIQLLQCSQRTLRRYLKDYKERDILFVKHKNSNKTPHNKTDPKIKEMAQFLTKSKYYDFNVLHLQEKLETHGLKIKRETLRKWSHEIGMVKRSHKKRSKPRYYRQRMPHRGVLIQMDGSYHRWFGKEKTCLIAAVDDATSEILFMKFYKSENTPDCLDFCKQLIKKHGAFQNLYVDRAGVYGGIKRSGFSQVERALGEVGTHVVYAHSPQGKGRIERLFNTLQDRMIPEMRLNKIMNMKSANNFLEDFTKDYNHRYSVQAQSAVEEFKKPAKNLDEVFCIKEKRQVGADHTISYRGDRYVISERFKYSIKNQTIEIRVLKEGTFEAYFGSYKINLIKIDKIERSAA